MNKSELQRHQIDGMSDPYFTIKAWTTLENPISGEIGFRIKPSSKGTGYGILFEALTKKLVDVEGLSPQDAWKRAQQSIIDVYATSHDISNGAEYLKGKNYARDVRLYYQV